MSKDKEQVMKEWLESRPIIVQELAERFPPSSIVIVNNEPFYVVGYTEGEQADLIVSRTNPNEDYEKAVATRERVCADCVSKMVSKMGWLH